MARVLVADDDGHIREVVRFALEAAGHTVLEAGDGLAALEIIARQARAQAEVGMIVLDIVMPEEDGLEVCRRIRAGGVGGDPRVPILFLSSRDDELDRVLGLELGGDDYVTKPFSPRELVARVKAMLRRAAPREPPPAEALRFGRLCLDRTRHRCEWAGHEVPLTVTEFSLLRALMSRPGRAYSRDELVDRTWGPGHHVTDRTIDSHVRRIRRKLAGAGADPDPIETVYGLGYRLRELDEG